MPSGVAWRGVAPIDAEVVAETRPHAYGARYMYMYMYMYACSCSITHGTAPPSHAQWKKEHHTPLPRHKEGSATSQKKEE